MMSGRDLTESGQNRLLGVSELQVEAKAMSKRIGSGQSRLSGFFLSAVDFRNMLCGRSSVNFGLRVVYFVVPGLLTRAGYGSRVAGAVYRHFGGYSSSGVRSGRKTSSKGFSRMFRGRGIYVSAYFLTLLGCGVKVAVDYLCVSFSLAQGSLVFCIKIGYMPVYLGKVVHGYLGMIRILMLIIPGVR
jgi:tRNA(Met) C34 N-acetyltransferase TmcA